MSESLTRRSKLESIRADEGGVWATLSTEFAVPRDYGNEILLHDPSAVDLSRAPLPLVVSHNTDELNIGLVEQIKIVGRKLKGFIRPGTSSRAAEIFEDIKAGILQNISIGYRILKSDEQGGNLVATLWQPMEVSLVAVGADPNAGIGRSFKPKGNIMITESKALLAENRTGSEEETSAIQDILMCAKKYNCLEEANEFIQSGRRDFRGFADEVVLPMQQRKVNEQSRHYTRAVETGTLIEGFSIRRAIMGRIDPRSCDDGLEREISREVAEQFGKRGDSIHVPLGVPRTQTRAMQVSVAGTGGNIVSDTYRPDLFIDALLAESAIMNLPITQFNGAVGDVVIPKASATPAVGWYDLDEADTISATDPTLAQVTLSPTSLAGLTTISRKTMVQSSPDADVLVQRMLAESLAAELDKQAVQGDGVSERPTGVINTSSIGNVEYTNGGNPDWADIVDAEAALTAANAPMRSVAYLLNPADAATMKKTEKATNTAQFILQNGMMNGYRVIVSSNVPAGTLVIGAWQEFFMATWGIMSLDVDPYGSNFAKGSISVRAIMEVDFAVRHPGAFATITEAAP